MSHLEGHLELSVPRSYRVAAYVLVIIFIVLLVSVMFVKYSPVRNVRGVLISVDPVVNIVAPRAGVVTEIFVQENSLVVKGQNLVKVRVQQPNGNGTVPGLESEEVFKVQTDISSDQILLEKKRALATRKQLVTRAIGLREEQIVLEKQISLHEQLIKAAQADYDRLLSYSDTGIVSKEQLQRGWQAILDRKSRLLELQQLVTSNKNLQRNIENESIISEIDSSSKVNGLKTNKMELTRLRALTGGEVEYLLRSPISGRVANLRQSVGKYVNEKTTILNVLPNTERLDAELMVPANMIGEVKVGQKVALIYDAFPYERFGSFEGKISYISKIPSIDMERSNPNIDIPVYFARVSAVEAPKSLRLRNAQMPIGGTLTAKIIIDKTSIFDLITNFKIFEGT